ncbi:hypothetical protein [Cupriavidus ulmosensis]
MSTIKCSSSSLRTTGSWERQAPPARRESLKRTQWQPINLLDRPQYLDRGIRGGERRVDGGWTGISRRRERAALEIHILLDLA